MGTLHNVIKAFKFEGFGNASQVEVLVRDHHKTQLCMVVILCSFSIYKSAGVDFQEAAS